MNQDVNETPRRAIILAAGDGGRLAGIMGALPKPLVPLAGRPIIEYTLDAATAAGIEEVLVVTGYREDEVREELTSIERPFGLTFASNPEYERGASYSLRAARSFGEEAPSLLLMSDHLLGAGVLQALASAHEALPSGTHASLVAADGCARDLLYTDEATKLALADGPFPREVIDIGKELPAWDALDCGAFMLDPSAWTAVDEAPEDCELSTIFRILADSGGLYAADASGMPWYDIDTPADLLAATRWLEARLALAGYGPGE
jgi:choline kinase